MVIFIDSININGKKMFKYQSNFAECDWLKLRLMDFRNTQVQIDELERETFYDIVNKLHSIYPAFRLITFMMYKHKLV